MPAVTNASAIEMSSCALAVIKGMRELFSDPAKHTTGVAARDSNGDECFVASRDAKCFCAIGGMMKVERELGADYVETSSATQALTSALSAIGRFQDGRSGRLTLVSVNEDGDFAIGPNGEELTGLPGIQRLLDYAIEHAVVI